MVDELIPEKKYFKIGETSSLLGVKPHVLRYWETEFPQIRPFKSRTGQRMYRRRDVEALVKIQKLLYEERFTIAGARQALRLGDDDEAEVPVAVTPLSPVPHLLMTPAVNPEIRASLQRLKLKLESMLDFSHAAI